MSRVTATGIYLAGDTGAPLKLDELRHTGKKKGLVFSGTGPTTLEVGIIDGNGDFAIIDDGAAASSDLREKDVITKFDGQSVRSMAAPDIWPSR